MLKMNKAKAYAAARAKSPLAPITIPSSQMITIQEQPDWMMNTRDDKCETKG
jgi:hypothetical protein